MHGLHPHLMDSALLYLPDLGKRLVKLSTPILVTTRRYGNGGIAPWKMTARTLSQRGNAVGPASVGDAMAGRRVEHKRSYGAVALLAALANGQANQAVGNVTSGAPMADLGYVKYQGIANTTVGINYFRGIQCIPNLPQILL
ncbi:hypothetical protein LTR33_013215 [Friedmanniomyces endolithicus]|nr:hypothetical protein LTR33_013215 [Friedmanniomyces endolithicus]